MMYYVNWRLTRAQLDLIASDVCVVDYSYGRKQKKKRNKGEFNDAKASSRDVENARKKWLDRYGDKSNQPVQPLSIGSVFGGSLTPTQGYR